MANLTASLLPKIKDNPKLDGMFSMMMEVLPLALMAIGEQAYPRNGAVSAKSK